MNTVPDDISARSWWLLFVLAIASSIPTFWFYLVGEEGILVNSSLEMWQRGDWLRLWFYGGDARHGVFANWLIILVAGAIGWEHAPAALRIVMVGATAAGGLMLAALVFRLYGDRVLAAMSGVILVTFADILFYRGWLGYRDPLLGTLVFGAIASLWVAVRSGRAVWLTGTVVFASCAFLTKGIIAYVFVGAAAVVFIFQREFRNFLLRPLPLVVAVMTLCLPYLWFHWVIGDQAQGGRMAAEIGDKLMPLGMVEYLWKLVSYPMETVVRLMPVPLLVGCWWWRRRTGAIALADPRVTTALLIAGVSFMPFWLAPQSHFRYLLPILPLIALALSVWVFQMGGNAARTVWRWLCALVVIKILLAAVLFPVYQHRVRGENYAMTARQVQARTEGFALYTHDVSAAGLSVTAYLNLQRLPRPVLTFAPAQWDDGFAFSNVIDRKLGSVIERYPLGNNVLYLHCRGAACNNTGRPVDGRSPP